MHRWRPRFSVAVSGRQTAWLLLLGVISQFCASGVRGDPLLGRGTAQHRFLVPRGVVVQINDSAVVCDNCEKRESGFEKGVPPFIQPSDVDAGGQTSHPPAQAQQEFPYHLWYGQHSFLPIEHSVWSLKAILKAPNFPSFVGDTPASYTVWLGVQSQSRDDIVIQPVLAYNSDFAYRYSLSSWLCCPGGNMFQSPPIAGVLPGDDIMMSVMRDPEEETLWRIMASVPAKSILSELVVAVDSFHADIAEVFLESYNVDDCKQYPDGSSLFRDITMVVDIGNYEKQFASGFSWQTLRASSDSWGPTGPCVGEADTSWNSVALRLH